MNLVAIRRAFVVVALALLCFGLPPLSAQSFTVLPSALPSATQPPEPATGSGTTVQPAEPSLRNISLSIEEALHIALEMNLDLRSERFTRDSAERDIEIARSIFDPLFNTSYTISKFRQPTVSSLDVGMVGMPVATLQSNPFESRAFSMGLSGLLPAGTSWGLSVSNSRGDNPESSIFGLNPRNEVTFRAEFTQPLLRNFWTDANLADYHIAVNNLEVSREQFRRLVETTVSDVNDAYWDVVFAQRDLEVKEESLTEAERLLEINQQRFDVGTATEIDISDARANIETQKSGIIEARGIRDRAQDDLLDLMNYGEYRERNNEDIDETGPYSGIRIVPTTPLSFEEYPVQLSQAQELAMENRSELKQADLVRNSAQIDVDRREDQQLPTLNLVGNWDQEGLDDDVEQAMDSVGSGRFYSWSLGLVFEYPLGNRSEENQLLKAKNTLRAAELDQQRTRNVVFKEVRQSVRDINTARQKIETTRAATQLRREQLNGETQRLRVGSSTSYQVLQVQNDLLEAQSLEIQAQVDYKKAVTSFERATGIILSTSGIIID